MHAVVEPLEGNKVKLTIEVDEQEFEKDLDAAFRKIAREVSIPGFRPGKAPRRILEARLGTDAGRVEALRDSLPGYYSQAVLDNEVDAIAAPEIDITSGRESGPIAFDAIVEVRPKLHLVGYNALHVTIPDPTVKDEDVDGQVDRLRARFGSLSTIGRPARDGDHLSLNIKATQAGEPLAALTADDFLYELGSASVVPELDTNLQGTRAGDILNFGAKLPDGTADLTVLVKEVSEKILPEATDEWANEASEFETIEELRADIAKQIGGLKRVNAALALRAGVLDALVELVDEDMPAALVDAETESRIEDLVRRLEGQGASLEQYLESTGESGEQLVTQMRAGAVPSVKADLALRAVADAEGLEPSDEDVDQEVERLAQAADMKPAQVRRNLDRNGQMAAVRSDWRKRKALEWLMEHAEIVDADGQPVDRALLEPEQPEVAATDPTPGVAVEEEGVSA